MGMGGHPLNIIQGAPTAGKSARNLVRLKKCEDVMKELKATGRKGSELYKSWANEYNRRMDRFHRRN